MIYRFVINYNYIRITFSHLQNKLKKIHRNPAIFLSNNDDHRIFYYNIFKQGFSDIVITMLNFSVANMFRIKKNTIFSLLLMKFG